MNQEHCGESLGELAHKKLEGIVKDETLTRKQHRLAKQALKRADRYRKKQGNG